jgi:hypothetical protein
MTSSESHLDLTRLEKVRSMGTKIIARCPACSESGGDRRGEHLAIMPSGKFACAAYPGDTEHRRRIFALVGVTGIRECSPEQERKWRHKRNIKRLAELDQRKLIETAREKRTAIIARHPWPEYDVWEDSPQLINNEVVEFDPRFFLGSLFSPDDFLWAGEVSDSGQNGRYVNCWRTCYEWQALPDSARIGPMTSPAIWKPGSTSRAASLVLAAPYTVLDFDGFDGLKPETPEQHRQLLNDSLALIRWLREGQCWQLATILWTGGKSLHAWFHSPNQAVLESLRITAKPLGLDAGLIGRPEHPCRLPGQIHGKTGKRSRVLWLQKP